MPGKDGTPEWWGTSAIPYTSEDKPFYLPFTQSLKETHLATLASFWVLLQTRDISIIEEWFCNYLTITIVYGDIFTLISCVTCENTGDNYIIQCICHIYVCIQFTQSSDYICDYIHLYLYISISTYLYLFYLVFWLLLLSSFSRARLLATPWSAAFQAPPSMGFSRQEYWSGVPLPSPVFWLGELNP